MSARKLRSPTSDLGVQQYIRDCNKYGAIPVSYFLRHVDDDKFVMKFYGLGPLGAKAISRPLEVRLLLKGNHVNIVQISFKNSISHTIQHLFFSIFFYKAMLGEVEGRPLMMGVFNTMVIFKMISKCHNNYF